MPRLNSFGMKKGLEEIKEATWDPSAPFITAILNIPSITVLRFNLILELFSCSVLLSDVSKIWV